MDGKQIGEHILVAEKKIGRRLHVNEVVHHINGNKLDNSPENLEVITRSEHATMHGHNRTKMVACLRCGKVRKHHGRGLCSNCYQYELLNGRIKNYELGGGNVVKIGVTE